MKGEHMKNEAQGVAENVPHDMAQDLSSGPGRRAPSSAMKVMTMAKFTEKLYSRPFQIMNVEPHVNYTALNEPRMLPRHATTAAAAVFLQLALRWGRRNWAAQWHLARALGKRFQGCRAKRLYVHISLCACALELFFATSKPRAAADSSTYGMPTAFKRIHKEFPCCVLGCL